MADIGDANLQLDAQFTEQEYQFQSPSIITQTFIGDSTTIITTINGAGGPSITISAGVTGYTFNTSGGTITLAVSSAATVRSSIGAAASGVNTDITQLNGASQVDVSSHYEVAGTQVVAAQQGAIPNPVGGLTVDTEGRAATDLILAAMRAHGLIAT